MLPSRINFGGKSRAASLVWERFGKPTNFVEPFFGSGAVLLACPEAQRPQVETVNDVSAMVANFWRAVSFDAEAVARWADFPVSEVDLHARHKWLLKAIGWLRARLDADPMFYDARIAGWWVWGASAWIGSGWCEENEAPSLKLPDVGASRLNGEAHTNHGKGLHGARMREPSRRLPDLAGGTQWGTSEANKRAGRGIHSETVRGPSRQLPYLGGSGSDGEPITNVGRGLNAAGMRDPSRKLPDMAASGSCSTGNGTHSPERRSRLFDVFAELQARLRHVRVACGDWTRICTDSVTHRHGLTAVFLDPPYEGFEEVYGASGDALSAKVRAWALETGKRPDMRIALCGYAGEHDALEAEGWEVVAWKAKGGFANQGDGSNQNSRRERIWFSPACLKPGVNVGQLDLLAHAARQAAA